MHIEVDVLKNVRKLNRLVRRRLGTKMYVSLLNNNAQDVVLDMMMKEQLK